MIANQTGCGQQRNQVSLRATNPVISPPRKSLAAIATPSIPAEVRVGRYGIGCRTYLEPNVTGPASYSIDAAGKRGVPTLTASQLSMLRHIQHFVRSPNLRFAFLSGGRFVVFEATDGRCSSAAPGYPILNDPTGLFYQPGEGPDFIHPFPHPPTPGPWFSPNQ